MQHFVRFLVDNWYILLEIFLLLLSVVFFILKKPTSKVVSGLYENLFNWCLHAVLETEDKLRSGSSKEKLKYAICLVYKDISTYYPDLNPEKFDFVIQMFIENILLTPTKKGGCGREKEAISKGK